MKSSRLFKMLVIAIALQSSSKAISRDMFGDKGQTWETYSWASLCDMFKVPGLALATRAKIVDEFRQAKTLAEKQLILQNAFNVDLKSTDAALISKSFKAQISKAITYKQYATLKAAGLWNGAASLAKSAKDGVVAIPAKIKANPKRSAVAAVAIAAAIWQRKPLIDGGKALASKVANSSFGQAVSTNASAAFSKVTNNASSALSWAWNKVPSMPSIRKSATVAANAATAVASK